MSAQHAKWLREAAEQIAKAGHNGWGNTCEGAAEHIDALEAELAALRADAEIGQAHREIERLRDRLSVETLALVETLARAEKAEAERDALRAALDWYGEKAKEMGKAALHSDSKRMLSLMHELAVDYGKRAALGER